MPSPRTSERLAGLDLQAHFLRRLAQVGGFVGGAFQVLGSLDETLLDHLLLQFVLELRLEAFQARYFRRLHAQQLDQVVAVRSLHRGGYLTLLQRIQRLLERGVVHAATGVAQVTAGGGRADILGELLGQRGEILALGQASLDLVDLRLGLLVADLVVHLDQDVCGIALLGKVGDFLLVQRLEVFLLHLDLVEEGGLLQLHVFDDHLLGSHELALVAFVEGLHSSSLTLLLEASALIARVAKSRVCFSRRAKDCNSLSVTKPVPARPARSWPMSISWPSIWRNCMRL